MSTDPVRILMLHGHGDCGQKFYHKTKGLCHSIRTEIHSQFQRDVEFVFPDAPLASAPYNADTRGWAHGDYRDEPLYFLEQSIAFVLEILEKQGPFDGVIGFSAGALVGVIVATMLERLQFRHGYASEEEMFFKLPGQISHPPFRFIVAYSGFMLGNPIYRDLYPPVIHTPVMCFTGLLDPVVPGSLTMALAKRCATSTVHSFWGTHYVPRTRSSYHLTSQWVVSRLLGVEDGPIHGREMPLYQRGKGRTIEPGFDWFVNSSIFWE
ncbi:serine hydrolase-domain-containing protein [Aspergillus egyptiacus]|nr:serine hydrolase-domain-containing protein [Aspergillus egyptiacus]